MGDNQEQPGSMANQPSPVANSNNQGMNSLSRMSNSPATGMNRSNIESMSYGSPAQSISMDSNYIANSPHVRPVGSMGHIMSGITPRGKISVLHNKYRIWCRFAALLHTYIDSKLYTADIQGPSVQARILRKE